MRQAKLGRTNRMKGICTAKKTTCRYMGDGNILACGPGGQPLATMRLENFRDGLEDYAYAQIYRERTGANVEVPDEVAKTLGDCETIDWILRLARK